MSAVLMFFAISAICGFVLGLYCLSWRLIVIPNLIIAIGSVTISLHESFSVFAGVAMFFGCLTLNEIAYLIGAAIIVFSGETDASFSGQADDSPSDTTAKVPMFLLY